jgi:putative ABC transport system permease protein
MQLYRTISLALRTLLRNPLRSFLMMLGVTIGIAALTTMASVGEATKQETMRRFKRMVGTYDILNIAPGAARTRGMPSLTTVEPSLKFEDAKAIAAEARTVTQIAEVQNAFDIDIKHRDNTAASAIYGISANWLEMHGYFIDAGTPISGDDVASLARVAVIGVDVQTALFPNQDPLGRQLRIANVPFQVKGVLVSRGAGPGGGSLDNIVFIPVTTASKRLFNRDYLTTINAKLKDPDRPEAAIKEISAILRERHGIVPPGEDDFTVTNPRATAEQVTEVRSTLSTVLTGVAVIAILIGGLVIMSLMLIAVSERRREIGVRRAVGATRRDVMVQFLIEAATISVLGGLTGVAFGVAGATIAAMQQDLPPILLWSAIGSSVGLSICIGLVFGLQPAWKAANLDPIEALRN